MRIDLLKLVYFSPSGTTKKIVEAVSEGLKPHSAEHVDITRPENRKRNLQASENELLIIGVPVYFGRVQTAAMEWLSTLKGHNTPVICVVVYGNREYDDALLELKDTMLKNGCIPIACAAYIGEHSFSNTKAPIAAGRPDADDLENAKAFGKKIGGKIASIASIGEAADIARAAKRADYFEAGTLVVWDVDPVADQVHKYRFDAPDQPEVFVRGQEADAEPAVPNWKMSVDAIFA